MQKMNKARSAAVGLAVAAAAMAVVPAASAASPKTVTPLAAQSCSGDVCEYLSTPSNGYVQVQAWAYNVTFYGTMYFTGPNGDYAYQGPSQYVKGKGFYSYVSFQAVVGKYCVTGYSPDNHTSGAVFEGQVCNSVK